MRLLFVNMDRDTFRGGSAVSERIRSLVNEVGEADLITFSTKSHGLTHSIALSDKATAYPTNSLSRFLYILDAYLISRRMKKPDMVSAQDPFETGLAAYFIAKHFKVPLNVDLHTDLFSENFKKHSLLNRIRMVIASFILKRADGTCVVSDKLKHQIIKYYPETPVPIVAPIYVNVEKYLNLTHKHHLKFKTALLWVGRMENEKNPELALNSLIELRARGYDVGLTFVGDGSLLGKLQGLVKKSNLSKYVEFPGKVEDVSPFYAAADLMLVTSKYEGYGLVIIEALSSGLPVISTDVGIAKDAGAIISTPVNMASDIENWLKSPKRGNLLLKTYRDEKEYIMLLSNLYKTILKK